MRSPRVLGCLSLFTLLSCALTPQSSVAAAAQEGETEFESIRFGDAEELAYDVEFFPGANYDSRVPTPDSVLGQKHGTRFARHDEMLECFRLWAETSDRVTLETTGRTHEGRELVVCVVTSAANQARIESIKENHAKLADPRRLTDGEADRLLRELPAVAWMGYSIHGDELSGTDAALALGYHLAACTDEDVEILLTELVVVIDPCLNPDGRERIIGLVEQSAGYTPNLDYASMHRGRWPGGRGNHYLFDMNRDWLAGSQPETRARWGAALEWNPQLFVDAHEMSALDNFLTYPQNDPVLPVLGESVLHFQTVFGDEAGLAFDAHGWGYYTREWADAWAPFYSDSWGSLIGAIGILYEQANTKGFALRRASGEILTYREAVHHQLAASVANLSSLQKHKAEILTGYLAEKQKNVAADTPGNELFLAVRSDGNRDRLEALQRLLDGQGIEYFAASEDFEMRGARGARGGLEEQLELPAGTWLIPLRQPQRALVWAIFEFDPRIDLKTLEREREDIERDGRSSMYDATSWSLAHALDLDAWWGEVDPGSGTEPAQLAALVPGVAESESGEAYAWVVDGRDDRSVRFAARAMELGLSVHFAEREFETKGAEWARGSLLIRRPENSLLGAELESLVDRAARQANAVANPVFSGRAPGDGPDLGGGRFRLLARPRIALLSNSPVSSSSYGHLWHQLDRELGVPFSILDAQSMRRYDLRRYNVIVLPPGGIESVLEPMQESLETWIKSGGTLVACGGSAAALTAGRLGISSVSLRRHALEELDEYALAVARERAARNVEIDEELVWNGAKAETEESGAEEESSEPAGAASRDEASGESLEDHDAWLRRFAPSGVHLLAETDDEDWLTVGMSDRLPVMFSGSSVFLSKSPARTSVRLAAAGELRLGGLLWPEGRERIADSAYLTRERHGKGQVILFAGQPAYRGYHLATGRLFSNAVIYGPGLGARQPVGW